MKSLLGSVVGAQLKQAGLESEFLAWLKMLQDKAAIAMALIENIQREDLKCRSKRRKRL